MTIGFVLVLAPLGLVLSYSVDHRFEVAEEYEVVISHRRIETAGRAELETVAVRLRDLGDWEALEYFMHDHIPIPQRERGRDVLPI